METDEMSLDELRSALREEQSLYQEQRMRSSINARDAIKERVTQLNLLLQDYQEFIDRVANRRPELLLTPFQTTVINDILRDCQALLRNVEGADYLKLAEGLVTYGEMSILLAPYVTLIWDVSLGKW